MEMLLVALFIVTAFDGFADGGTTGITAGSCKYPSLKKDLDVAQYGGLWYEIQRFPNNFEEGLICVQAYYGRIDDKAGRPQVSVTNAGRKNTGTGEKETVVGTAFQSYFPGTLKVKFTPGAPFYAKYKVIDTDYTNYASVYSCTNFLFFKLEFAWILGRSPSISESALATARAKYSDAGIDVSQFIPITQGGDCLYVLDSNGNVVS